MRCLLCYSNQVKTYHKSKKSSFYQCDSCDVIFRNPADFILAEEEKERYLLHNEDVNDQGYRASVQPLVDRITKQQNKQHKGLDYGAGTSAIVAKMLQEKGFHINIWDPFFHSDTSVFNALYDFISCSEAMEHFHQPLHEFKKMYALLDEKGAIYCKTELVTKSVNFENWYYKNDMTHVIFYTPKSIQWLQENVGFASFEISGNIIVFER